MYGVFSKQDFEQEEGQSFAVSDRLEFSAFSLDIRVKRLFRHNERFN